MAATLAGVLGTFGRAYLAGHSLSSAQARVWRAIEACRTLSMGGRHPPCDGCGRDQWLFNSAACRHSPQCQSGARDAQRQARLAELLPVPYCHLVFTLPHAINALAQWHPRWVCKTLMQCAAATLTELAANPRWLGATGAGALVLHTWTQDLRRHLHVHALMACGALAKDDDSAAPRWQPPRRSPTFLIPVHALSQVFKGKFIAALDAAAQGGRLRLEPACHPTCDPAQRRQHRQALQAKPWVVYAKTALAGPAAVQGYLSRYTQRTAIGNERLPGIRSDAVRPTTRVNGKHGQPNGRTVTTLDGVEFVRRLLQHVVPSGFKRIRHDGLLAPAPKTQGLAAARHLLGMPAAKPVAAEAVVDFMRRTAGIDIEHCTDCKVGRWRVIGCQARNRGGGVGGVGAAGAVGAVGAVAVGTVDTAAATAAQRPHQAAPQALHACRGPP